MAKKQVIWSIRAQQDRIAILDYWIERNKSKTYSKKLLVLFNQAADLISEHPRLASRQIMEMYDLRLYGIIYCSMKRWTVGLKYYWFGIADKTLIS